MLFFRHYNGGHVANICLDAYHNLCRTSEFCYHQTLAIDQIFHPFDTKRKMYRAY